MSMVNHGMDAAAWFARMRSDVRTVEDEIDFERWLAQDPSNERAYQELEGSWGDLDVFRDCPEIVAARRAAQLESQRSARDVRSWRDRPGYALAAGLAVIAVSAAIAFDRLGMYIDEVHRTSVGQRESVKLADGSEVVLNTDSMLRVRYWPWSREVELERGQAYFKVAKSPMRTFEVQAGTSRVRALGTEFDVRLEDNDVKVTLVEGRIEVVDVKAVDETQPAERSRAELTAGQTIAARPSGLSSVYLASIPRATAWLQGRLVFENERLPDAVGEVNRYSPTRLVISDDGLVNLRVSGVFDAGRVETFVDALKASFAVEAKRAPDGTLLLMSARPAS